MSGGKFFRRLVRYLLCFTAGLLAFAACAYTDYRLWPLDRLAPRCPALPAPKIQSNRLILPFAPGIASAKVAGFHDQLEAFLHFEYLRGREARDGGDASRSLLTAVDTATGPSYEIFIVCDNDLLTAVPHLAQLEGRNLISRYDLNTCMAPDREGRRPRLPEKAEPGFSVLRDGRVLAGVSAEVAGRFTMGEGFPDHGKSYERENRLYPCAGERSRDFNRVQGD